MFPIYHKIKQFKYSKLKTNNTNTNIIFYKFYFNKLYIYHTITNTIINILILTLTIYLKFSIKKYLTIFI